MKIWTDEEVLILKEKYGTMPKLELCEKYFPNKTYRQVTSKVEQLKLTTIPKYRNLKNSYNTEYFNELTIENCYWAGFIAADGCLGIDVKKSCSGKMVDTYKVQINISQQDISLLETFKQHIGYKGNIFTYSKQCDLSNCISNMALIYLYRANEIHDSLGKYFNMGQRKTFDLIEPSELITGDFALSYICGLFDGDGCWAYHTQNTTHKYSFQLCGTERILIWVRDQLNLLVPEYTHRSIKIIKAPGMYRLNIGGLRSILIRNIIKNRINIPWKLSRKWETPINKNVFNDKTIVLHNVRNSYKVDKIMIDKICSQENII